MADIVLDKNDPNYKEKLSEKRRALMAIDRKSTRLNSSHGYISYAVFCLKKKKKQELQIKRLQYVKEKKMKHS